ncbi:MAG: uracil phosphoribosyltransferase [Planctomycetota bacterium]
MTHVHILNHPLVDHHLATLRDEMTRSAEFRATVSRLAMLIGVEATRELAMSDVSIQTPVGVADGKRLATVIGLVPVLRAGLGMVTPMQDLIPDASVWHLGLYRNEQTAEPVGYYDKLPQSGAPNVALVLDPMLATGGSIDLVVRRLQRWGVDEIRVCGIIASQIGIDRVAGDFPDVKIFVAAVDPQLDDNAFIVPGLGDAGDRIFDTPQHD